MTIEEIKSRKEDQTFDCKSIQIDPKALGTTGGENTDQGGSGTTGGDNVNF